eukprot:scaffold9674_cov180-Isochrysis_galbana.AAC.1
MVRLTGTIGNQWCFTVVPRSTTFSLEYEEICNKHFVEPSGGTPDDPDAYPNDCSLGCRKCVYTDVGNINKFVCRGSSTKIVGCPAPSPPP